MLSSHYVCSNIELQLAKEPEDVSRLDAWIIKLRTAVVYVLGLIK